MSDKLYGPYRRKEDGRWIIIVNGETRSYPRYLYEQHHNCTITAGYEVDHKDDNPDNNCIDNLQLLTKAENLKKQSKLYITPKGYKQSEEHKRSGVKNGMAKLTEEQIARYRKMPVIHGYTVNKIMEETGMCRKSVYNLLKRKSYK